MAFRLDLESVLTRQRLYATLFSTSNEKILVVVRVDELGGKGADGKHKPRLVCVTLRNDDSVRLYKIKDLGNGQFKESQAWRLEDVLAIENAAEPSLQFTITFAKGSLVASSENPEDRDELLWTLISACRKYLGVLPKLRNVNESRLAGQVTSQRAIHSVAQRLARQKGAKVGGDFGTAALGAQVEPEEDPDNEDLDEDAAFLATFDWSLSDPAALENQLFGELNGLESANLYALIQCDHDLEMALERVDDALEELDTLEIILKRFNVQLEQLGQDIKQIEIQNNANQTQTANQRLLMNTLQEITTALNIPTTSLDTLNTGNFDSDRDLEKLVAACQALQKTLSLQLPRDMTSMAAIEEKLSSYRDHQQRFSQRLMNHIEKLLETEMDACLSDKGRLSRKGELHLCSHSHIHARLARLQPLADWMAAMDPTMLLSVQKIYSKHMGRLYRKELREFFDIIKQSIVVVPSGDDEDAKAHPSAVTLLQSSSGVRLPKRLAQKSTKHINISKALAAVRKESIKRGNGFSETYWTFSFADEDNLTVSEAFRRVVQMVMPVCAGEEQFVTKFFPPAALESLVRLRRQSSIAGPSSFSARRSSRIATLADGESKESAANAQATSEHEGTEPTRSRSRSIYEGIGGNGVNVDEATPAVRSYARSVYEGHSGRPLSTMDDASDKSDSMSITGDLGRLRASVDMDADGLQQSLDDQKASVLSTIVDTLSESVSSTMFLLFETLSTELASTVDASLKSNPMQSLPLIGVISSAKQGEETVSVYFLAIMDVNEKNKIVAVFEKFVAEQVRQLQQHTLLSGKHKHGVLQAVQNFPSFIESVEALIGSRTPPEKVRKLVDDTYRRLAQALVDAFIISDEQMNTLDEKERRQLHIAIVQRFKNAGLEDFTSLSRSTYEGRLAAYITYVCKKALGKLNEFFEGVDMMLQSRKEEEVGFSLLYNKNACRKVIREFTSKDLRKELQDLHKRVSRDWGGSEGLEPIAWRAVQEELIRLYRHFSDLIERCYPQAGIELGFTIENVLTFSTEAATVGGSSH